MTVSEGVLVVLPPRKARVRAWALSYGAALAWLWVTNFLPPMPLVPSMLWLSLPGIVALCASRAARTKWWRWPLLAALFFVTYVEAAPVVLALGMGWIVSDAWISSRTHITVETNASRVGRPLTGEHVPPSSLERAIDDTAPRPARRRPKPTRTAKAAQVRHDPQEAT